MALLYKDKQTRSDRGRGHPTEGGLTWSSHTPKYWRMKQAEPSKVRMGRKTCFGRTCCITYEERQGPWDKELSTCLTRQSLIYGMRSVMSDWSDWMNTQTLEKPMVPMLESRVWVCVSECVCVLMCAFMSHKQKHCLLPYCLAFLSLLTYQKEQTSKTWS